MNVILLVWLRCNSGIRITLGSLVFGIVGVAPIYLYMAIGPEDGNPIGLGILALFSVAAGGVGVCVGLIKMLVQYFKH